MALERPPTYLRLNPEMVKSYRPVDGQVAKWHVVSAEKQENFKTIAVQHGLPVEQIIEFNFPGSVEGGRVIPEIVNWYLHYHKEFGCPETSDRINRIFKGGEKIAIPRMASGRIAGSGLPTLDEAKKWFVEKVIPLQTAKEGYSANRTWKTPRGWLKGNVEDANGLCGDTTLFVAEQYNRDFKDYRTSDGWIVGMILWEGGNFGVNHIANVMLLQVKSRLERYTYDPSKGQTELFVPGLETRVSFEKRAQYETAPLLALCIFDLYYKEQPCPLRQWWTYRSASLGGMITIGLQQDFA